VTDLTARVCAAGLAAGLAAVGVAAAEPFEGTRAHLLERRARGLHAGMQFTYRRPERSADPTAALPGARALVVGARAYDAGTPAPPPGVAVGRVARYAATDTMAPLVTSLGAVADVLRAAGWRTRVLADDNALVDREAARRAGIGFYGKSTNLLLPGRGSWFVLGAVLTDAPLTATARAATAAGEGARAAGGEDHDGCGACTRCLDGCPTGAIVAPGVVDARRCLAWLLQQHGTFPRAHRRALADRIYGCDDCQEVCPPNHGARRGEPASVDGVGGPGRWVPLVELLRADDAELLARIGRWYVPRRDPVVVRRNALVALGNVGDPADPEVRRLLADVLASPDPVLRGHAVWAARRLGLDELVAPLRGHEADPAVRSELDAPVPLAAGATVGARPAGAAAVGAR